jgi:murein DD-endopeptidase MepM/ murein hydrolase activator NlpD
VGELKIQTDDGHVVILGHMGLITVPVGTRVEFGQLVGLSGGDNGDHLHLEVRHGGTRLVDPRQSFLIAAIEESIAAQAGDGAVASSRRSDETDAPEGTPAPDDDPEERGDPA